MNVGGVDSVGDVDAEDSVDVVRLSNSVSKTLATATRACYS